MNPNAWPGLPKGRSVGTCDVQLKEPVLISTTSTSWTWSLIQKWPMLSSSPAGMPDGSNVMVSLVVLNDTTRGRPSGSGLDVHRRPFVTFAGMP